MNMHGYWSWLTLLHLPLQSPSACQQLIDDVESTMRHTIVEEEKIAFETVTNFEEVCFNMYMCISNLNWTKSIFLEIFRICVTNNPN